MPYADLGQLRLCYEISGPVDGEPLLLIHGLGAQMIAWYPGFCRALEAAGFKLIRFDNRDVGLSSKLEDTPDYSLADMASDVVGLLEALGLESVHLVGQSMGGMIAQELAISHPERVRSLCSIYSAPSAEYLTDDELFWTILERPAVLDRDQAILQWIDTERLSGLEGFDAASIHEFAAVIYDRNYCPQGLRRQAQAMLNGADRSAGLAQLSVPTAVIHGRDDRVVSYTGGVATALAVPDAELHLYAGMGHQVTPRLWSEFVRVIARNVQRTNDGRTAAVPVNVRPGAARSDRADLPRSGHESETSARSAR